ncbi:MAG: hypothetical protein JXA18_11910 [Chitinispirillaceae bacterium]|nr:hypothetical protein [Chitinispirillaceae bacterium]
MRFFLTGAVLFFYSMTCSAAPGIGFEDPETTALLSLSGQIEFDMAEMLKARTSKGGSSNTFESKTVDHIWYGHAGGMLNLRSRPMEWFEVRTGFEVRQYMTTLPLIREARYDPYFGQSYWNSFHMREAQGIVTFVNDEPVLFELAFGYMPYKYNPEVRDLGEFLFRSGTYPLYLLGEFDRPFARLTGLRTGLEVKNSVIDAKIDVFGLIERDIRPFNDISIAMIAGIDFLKMVNAGAGIDFSHLIPMDGRLTTIEEDKNQYVTDSSAVLDSLTGDTLYWENDYDYYTFSGTKLMVRATLDPFGRLRGNDGTFIQEFLGESGGKIYGEFAVIGLKDYPGTTSDGYNPRGYLDIRERSPWMVGFTIPLWKIFDICALEVERFPSYFPDSYFRPVINGYPLPTAPQGGSVYDSTTYVPRWNWSLYLKKRLVRNFSLICQIGRNHQRWEYHPAQQSNYDFETAMVKPDEWGWRLVGRLSF